MLRGKRTKLGADDRCGRVVGLVLVLDHELKVRLINQFALTRLHVFDQVHLDTQLTHRVVDDERVRVSPRGVSKIFQQR